MVRPYTCVNYDILLQMRSFLHDLDRRGVRGDVVEAGCWRGGCGAFMAAVAPHRTVRLYDSFDVFPPLKAEDGTYAQKLNIDVATEADVQAVSDTLQVKPVVTRRFFKDLETFSGHIALLRLDGDLYDSTMDALNAFYDAVVPGGYIVIDDFDFPGCRMALYDFFAERRIAPRINPGGRFANAYFVKE